MIEKEKIVKMLLEIGNKAFQECRKHYPKHLKKVKVLYDIFLDIMVRHHKYDFDKFHDYLEEFSNYIAKKYFPDEINDLYRRPIALEKEITKHLFWRINNIWSKQQKAEFDSQYIEAIGLPAGKFFGENYWTEQQISQAYGVPIEELRKIAETHKEELGNILKTQVKGNKRFIVLDDLKLYNEYDEEDKNEQ